MTAMKFDSEKPRVDLLDADALEGLAKVLAFGAKKYAAHNWRGGLSYSRLIAAALRHTFAILRGEDVDSESGYPHVDHLGCCWMFLSNMMKTRPDMDDRWKGKDGTVVKGNRSDSEGDRAYPERLSELSPPNAAAIGGCLLQPTQFGRGGWGAAWGDSQGAQEGTNGFIGFGNERTR